MDQIQNKPETELPWTSVDDTTTPGLIYSDDEYGPGFYYTKDRDYIVHACNAYPKLIEFLKKALNIAYNSHGISTDSDCASCRAVNEGYELLKDLGEE